MIKGCIFDLDGTLLNTVHALTYTTNLVLAHFGLGPIDEAHIMQFVGDGYRCQMERSLRYAGDVTLSHLEESLPLYMELFAKHCLHEVAPYPGIDKLLETLKEKKVKIAVLSNKPHARAIETIETIFGVGYFDLIYGEQPGVPKKPDPTGVYRILDQWGIQPSECLYVGDTNTDMKTGLGAGLVTAGVTWGFRDREELAACHPDRIVDHPSELMELLDR